jgi:streptogramin lyase
MTVGADGNLWFGEYSFIGRITPSGAVTQFPVTRYSGAYDVTDGPDGNVWFAEVGGKVGYVTPAGGECVRYFVRGIFYCPVPDAYPVPFLRAI